MDCLSNDDVRRVEERVDDVWSRVALPVPSYAEMAWLLLATAERMLAETSPTLEMSSLAYSVQSLQHALSRALEISSERLGFERVPQSGVTFRAEHSIRTADVLRQAADYQLATVAISAFYQKQALARKSGREAFEFRPHTSAARRRAFDWFDGMITVHPTPIELAVATLLQTEPDSAATMRAVKETIKFNDEGFTYSIDARLHEHLIDKLGLGGAYLLPEGWSSPWGTAKQTIQMLRALQAIAFYEWCVTFVVARSTGRTPIAVRPSRPSMLARQIERVTRIPSSEVSGLLRALTYEPRESKISTGLQRPNVMVKPLLLLAEDVVAFSPIIMIFSFLEGHLVRLLARTHQDHFNQNSGVFSRHMTAEILRDVPRRYFRGGPINIPGFDGDIDVAMADPSTATLTVCELKWNIPTATWGEMWRKDEECVEKVRQARQMAEWARKNTDSVLRAIGVHEGALSLQWTVLPLVVTDGYLPLVEADCQDVQVVHRRALKAALAKFDSLSAAYAWLASNAWLPRENDFETRGREALFENLKILWLGGHKAAIEAVLCFRRETLLIQ